MKIPKRFDSLIVGLILGIIAPITTLLLIWAFRYHGNLWNFLVEFQEIGALSKLVSLSVIPNLLIFFVFNWLERPLSSKGVIFATFIVAFVMLILKFS